MPVCFCDPQSPWQRAQTKHCACCDRGAGSWLGTLKRELAHDLRGVPQNADLEIVRSIRFSTVTGAATRRLNARPHRLPAPTCEGASFRFRLRLGGTHHWSRELHPVGMTQLDSNTACDSSHTLASCKSDKRYQHVRPTPEQPVIYFHSRPQRVHSPTTHGTLA